LAASLVSLVALAAPGGAQASFPGDNGRIAFTQNIRYCSAPPAPCGDVLKSVNPDGTGLSEVASPGTRPAGSADGTKLAYTDGLRVFVSNPDGSDPTMVLDWGQPVGGLAWSPSGQELAASLETCADDECRPDIYTFNLDGSGLADLTPDLLPDRDPSWSPDGSKIAFGTVRSSNNEVFVLKSDGTGATNLSNHPGNDFDPNWSPDGNRIAFVRTDASGTAIWLMDADGSAQLRLTDGTGREGQSFWPSWSPDGTSIVYTKGDVYRSLHVVDVQSGSDFQVTPTLGDSTDDYPEWLQVPPPPPPDAYPRPRGATPLYIHFVPAFDECTSPNGTHGEPLAFGSCSPPGQASSRLSVGTPEANGQRGNAIGRLWLRALAGRSTTQFDDADVEVLFDTGDVRETGSLADYAGELSMGSTVRITDRASEPFPTSATVEDIPVFTTVPCGTTPSDPNRGSSCNVDTTIDSVLGNVIVEGARTIWELGQVQVYDGGPDGDADTQPNSLFEVQGLFVP
jgi:WD40 repeat protein